MTARTVTAKLSAKIPRPLFLQLKSHLTARGTTIQQWVFNHAVATLKTKTRK